MFHFYLQSSVMVAIDNSCSPGNIFRNVKHLSELYGTISVLHAVGGPVFLSDVTTYCYYNSSLDMFLITIKTSLQHILFAKGDIGAVLHFEKHGIRF